MAEKQSHPFRGFFDVMSEMERMRNLGTSGFESGQQTDKRTHGTAWVPTVDVVARGQDLVISAEIAGVAPQDIDISVCDGVLTRTSSPPTTRRSRCVQRPSSATRN